MVIYTNSGRIKKYRKLIVELLLSAHCRDCTTCVKSGECVLQDLAHRMNITTVRFQNTREIRPLTLAHLLWSGTPINVFSAVTVSVPAARSRGWEF